MQRIILDTDPGIDDALALFLALASPQVQLEAVTTVSGNVDVAQTTRNALALLALAGRSDIPVARGCGVPLMGPLVNAAHVHGQNGLGGVELPQPQNGPVSSHAVDLIIEKVMSSPKEITLVPIGPLTNIALAVRREPRLVEYVRELVIMGGALRVPGNVTPSAEFNIYADPQAAHIVLHAGWPIRLVSLDVTTRTIMRRMHANRLAQHGTPVATAIQQMIAFCFDVFEPGRDRFHMHDPLCLAAAFLPDFITWEASYVDVELQGKLTLGQTVGYFQRANAPAPNVLASVAVDSERFIEFYLAQIEQGF